MTIDAGEGAPKQESIRAVVEREIREEKEDAGQSAYLDNFHTSLPVSADEYDAEMSMSKRVNLEQMGLSDTKFGEMAKFPFATESGNSDLLINQTPRELWATIDRNLIETGVDLEEIKRLQRAKGGPDRKAIFGLVEEGYIRLREMGYTSTDLKA